MPDQLPHINITDAAASLAYGILHGINANSDGEKSEKAMVSAARADYQKLREYLRKNPSEEGVQLQRDFLGATASKIETSLFLMMKDEKKIPDLSHIMRSLYPPYDQLALVETMLLHDALHHLEEHITQPDQIKLLSNNTEWQNIKDIVAGNVNLMSFLDTVREFIGDYHSLSEDEIYKQDYEVLKQNLSRILKSIDEGQIVQDKIIQGRKADKIGTLSQLQHVLDILEKANEFGIDTTVERQQLERGVTAIVEIVKNAPISDLTESAITKGDSVILTGRSAEKLPDGAATPKYGSYFIAQLRRLCDQLGIPSVPRGEIVRDRGQQENILGG